MQCHALVVSRHRRSHVRVQRWQHLLLQLDQIHLQAAAGQDLRPFESDEARPDDDRALRAAAVDPRADRVHVLDIPQHEDVGGLDPIDRRHDRSGSRGQDQLVVALPRLLPAVQVPNAHTFGQPVDLDHFALHPGLDAELPAEPLGRHQQQPVAALDDVAHVIGQTAVGERNVAALFEDDDLGVFVQTACPRSRTSSGCDTAHDQDSTRHRATPCPGVGPRNGR
jgi:hypothetical protein